jgi:hypothetical protein
LAVLSLIALKVRCSSQTKAEDAKARKQWERTALAVTTIIWLWGAIATVISSLPNRYNDDDAYKYNLYHGHLPMTSDELAVVEGLVDGMIGIIAWMRGRNGIQWGTSIIFAAGFVCAIAGLVSSVLSLMEHQVEYAFSDWRVGLVFSMPQPYCGRISGGQSGGNGGGRETEGVRGKDVQHRSFDLSG